jgi:phage-related protein
MIRESTSFTYRGRTSEDMGLINVNIGSSGMLEETFLAGRSILEEKIRGRDEPYFYGFTKEPLTIPVTFAFANGFDTDKLKEVAEWLTPDYYSELVFDYDWQRVYYAMVVDEPKLVHNAAGNGYIQITFRCNSPYSYSPTYQLASPLDLSSNTISGTNYTFENLGNRKLKPIIYVEIVSGTAFKIVNTSNSGRKIEFTGLAAGENLTVDCDMETIESDIPLTYRYANMTSDSDFIEMVPGKNYLKIYGQVLISFKWQNIFE